MMSREVWKEWGALASCGVPRAPVLQGTIG